MATIKEIAKLANVSTATVSYALNDPSKISEETREKVLQVINRLNYRPNSIAKSLKVKKTNTIGIITEDIATFIAPEIINGIDEYAEKNQYHIILNNIRLHKRLGIHFNDTAKYAGIISEITSVLLSKQVDGFIYLGVYCRDVTGLIDKIPVPIVYTYCFTRNDHDVSVCYDDELAAYEIVQYLIGKGHRKIGIVTGLMDSIHAQDRLKGYQRALYEHNILFNPQYMVIGDWNERGYAAGKELLTLSDPPTAIFAMNDIMAGGVIDAANELGIKIPEELSLVGFDNRECSSAYTPKLTTMAIPLNEMGQMSAETLIAMINGGFDYSHHQRIIKLRCKLVERNSVSRNGK